MLQLTVLDESLWFPSMEQAMPDGLLAIGGDLRPERLISAYKEGIFPWYDGEVPLWWCPDPRFVLYPSELRVSKSMKQLLKREAFEVTFNKVFQEVILACKNKARNGQDGTWINDDVVEAYTVLHHQGLAISAECWAEGLLVGGLYGIRMGRAFFGESMFAHVSNASKYAFVRLVQQLRQEGVELIDCQVYSEHLESLGARMIPRASFLAQLQGLVP